MASTAQKWLTGCGLGCLTLVILVALAIYGGSYCVRNLGRDFERSEKKSAELTARFGALDDYVPPLDGVPARARIESFLAVRDSLARFGGELDASFATFSHVESGRKDLMSVLGAVRGGLSLAPLLAHFYDARNGALAAQGMGLGEYTYIYCLAYFSFLGLDPEAMPAGLGSERADNDNGTRDQIHRHMSRLLANLQAALDSSATAGQRGDATFRAALDKEMALLLTDPDRVPWQDGPPPAIASALAPFRDRLQASYHPAMNLFEMGVHRGRGRGLQIDVESSRQGD